MDIAPAGKLELTWTNKHLRLLADEAGGYTWVPPSDYRVAEVRLLHDVQEIGDTRGVRSRAQDNLLIRGDALNALTSLCELPEFAREYVGKVKLVYLDPPFNTQQAFEHYDDTLEHSVWLTMMRDRLLQIRKLLAPDGSVWVHCDDSEQHRLRVMMDELLGESAFVATIVWQKRYSRDNRPAIGTVHDYLHVYALDPIALRDRRNRLPRDAKTEKQYRNPNNHPGGPWRVIPLDAQGFRANQMYDIVSPTGVVHRPPKGRCWGMREDRFRELEVRGRIYYGKDGTSKPGIIRYLSETEGLVPWTWWPSTEAGHSDEAKKEILDLFQNEPAFGTPKPERLMYRIAHIATNPGDIVLDCFAGSATTAAVAQKMGRRWVTVERESQTVETFALPRLEKVVAGDDPGGVTEQTGSQGGGGFRVLEVAPSMFAEVNGRVWLAEWAVDRALAEATAAQLGFDYEPDPPFAGRKGRSRLAVVDGLVNEDVVELLVGAAAPEERLVVCGTAIDPAAADRLKTLRSGSRTRKIPASILAEYRIAGEWRPARSAAPA